MMDARSICLIPALCVCAAGVVAAQEDPPKKHHEITYQMTLKNPPPGEPRCKAKLEYTFQQKNTVAAVDSVLRNPDCPASYGSYTVVVRFRGDDREVKSLEYPVTWERDDDQPITTEAEYLIGENVDLVTVRTRQMRCLCAATQEADDTDGE